MYEMSKKMLLAFALLLICVGQARANIELDPIDKQTVKQLMRLESERLLQSATVEKTSQSKEVTEVAPHLVAMYGVGKRVVAEVLFNGRSYVYLRGQTWPVGDQVGKNQLRLLSMTSRCVHLAYQQQEHELCVPLIEGVR